MDPTEHLVPETLTAANVAQDRGGDGPRYFPVARAKFIALVVLTFGIYELYWFYRNWKYVRQRDSSDIWPFWRAVFSPVWYYALILDIRKHTTDDQTRVLPQGGVLSLAYLLMAMTWRLPDPYWLFTLLAFLPMLPTVQYINSLNQDSRAHAENSRFRFRHAVLALFTVPLLALIVGPSLKLMPATVAVNGDQVPSWHIRWMREEGLLDDDETVIYFYSADLLSFRSDGNVVTDKSVISYWMENDELYGDYAYYDQIASVEVEFTDSLLDDTVVMIRTHDGEDLVLLVSPEEETDHLFVEAIEQRAATARARLESATPETQAEQDSMTEEDVARVRELAEAGDPEAQFQLGSLYVGGLGLPEDPEKALEWLTRSAEQNYAEAQQLIGEIYDYGVGVDRDPELAVLWYRKAAEQGLATAYDYLGMFQAQGLGGLEPHCGKAQTWYRRAISAGYEPAKNNLAWSLATCVDIEYRNGERALELALQMVGDSPQAAYLDTLAAAYAELGDFEQAIEMQRKAIDALLDLGATEELADARSRFLGYIDRKPARY